MDKHTSLPWSYEGGCVRSKSGIVARRDGDSYFILPVERDANMRYIVTACNAYPALIEALLTIAMANESVFGYAHPERKMIEIARAALAQAKGDE